MSGAPRSARSITTGWSREDIVRAYEVGRDQVVPITDEALDNLPLPTARTT